MKHQRKMAFKKVRTLQEDVKCPAEPRGPSHAR